MDNKNVTGMIYGLAVIGLWCFTSSVLAATVHLKFSAHYTLPPGIRQAIPSVRLGDAVNNTQHFSRVFMPSALTPSQPLSQGIFFPHTTTFVSPGLALDNGHGTTYYAYCAEQVPYRDVQSKQLEVVFGSVTKSGWR